MLQEIFKVEEIKKAVRLVDLEGLDDIVVKTKDMVLLINYIEALQAVAKDKKKKIMNLEAQLFNPCPRHLDTFA